MDFLNFFKENTNLGIFLIATLTFMLTFIDFYKNRASIKIDQLETSTSFIIKPDFIDTETPDDYWNEDYRVISNIIITNNSAKPISIIEFMLNDVLKFNSYTRVGKFYKITTQPSTKKLGKGIYANGNSRSINLEVDNHWLQPIIDVPPHTSVRGFLMFHFNELEAVNIGKNKLEIITSRKTFQESLLINEHVESALPLPDKVLSARDQFAK